MVVAERSSPIWPGLAVLTLLFGLFAGATIAGGRGLLYRARPSAGCAAVLEQLDDFAAWYNVADRPGGSLAAPRVDPGASEAYIAALPELNAYRQWWQGAAGVDRVPTPDELQSRHWLELYLDRVC